MERNKIKLSKKRYMEAFLKWTFSHIQTITMNATGKWYITVNVSYFQKNYILGIKKSRRNLCKDICHFTTRSLILEELSMEWFLQWKKRRANGADIDDDAINNIKTGLMGPMAGIGDTLWQGTLQPIALAVGISIASGGNVIGALVFALIMAAVMYPIAYFMYMKGYTTGKAGVEAILSGER